MEIPRRNFRKLSPGEMAKAAEAAAEVTPDDDLETPAPITEESSSREEERIVPPKSSKDEELLIEEPIEPIEEEEVTFGATRPIRDRESPKSSAKEEPSKEVEDLVFTAPVSKETSRAKEETVSSTGPDRLPEVPREERGDLERERNSIPVGPKPSETVRSTFEAGGSIPLELIDRVLRAKEITDSISTDPRELMSSPEVKLIDSSLETPAELIHALLSEESSKFATFNTFNEIMDLDLTARPFKVLRLDEGSSLSLLSLVESLSGSDPVEIKDEIDRAYRITSLIAGLDERAIESVARSMRVIKGIRDL